MADSADNVDASTEAPKKPWGEDANFDAERAWTLIQSLRSDKASLTDELGQARSALAQAEQERDQVQKELVSDRRDAILKEFDIDDDLAEMFLGGDLSVEELRRRAERLAGKTPAEEPKDGDKPPAPQEGAPKPQAGDAGKPAEDPKPPTARPKPRPSTGEGGPAPAPFDPAAIAAAARQR